MSSVIQKDDPIITAIVNNTDEGAVGLSSCVFVVCNGVDGEVPKVNYATDALGDLIFGVILPRDVPPDATTEAALIAAGLTVEDYLNGEKCQVRLTGHASVWIGTGGISAASGAALVSSDANGKAITYAEGQNIAGLGMTTASASKKGIVLLRPDYTPPAGA